MFSILFWVGCDQQTTEEEQKPNITAPQIGLDEGEAPASAYFQQVVNSVEFSSYILAVNSFLSSELPNYSGENPEAEADLLSQALLADPQVVSAFSALSTAFPQLGTYAAANPGLLEEEMQDSEDIMAMMEIALIITDSPCPHEHCEDDNLACGATALIAYNSALLYCMWAGPAAPACAASATGVFLAAALLCEYQRQRCCEGYMQQNHQLLL